MGKRNKGRSRNANDVSSQQLRFYDSLAFASPDEARLQQEFDFAPAVDVADRRRFTPDRRSLRSYVEFVPVGVKRPFKRGPSLRGAQALSLWSPPGRALSSGVSRERRVVQEKVCSERSTRREVMFAKKRAGRAGQRKQRQDWRRKVRC